MLLLFRPHNYVIAPTPEAEIVVRAAVTEIVVKP